MRLRESRSEEIGRDLLNVVAGSIVGFGIGLLLSRQAPRQRGAELRDRLKGAVRRLRPARKERLLHEQEDLDRLEELTVDEFLQDEVLSERAIDIGAITAGIIELTGTVESEEEAERAVSVARRVPGVDTVVNRLDIQEHGHTITRRRLDPDDLEATFAHQEARVGGMGRRRQGLETEPDRPDDSQRMREGALAAADRDQWSEEGYVPVSGRGAETSDLRSPQPTNFREDELDNQDPHGKHADYTLDEPPEALDSSARVGDGDKPGVERM